MSNLMPASVVTPPSATPYPETEIEFLNCIWQALGGGSSSGGGGGQGSIIVNGTPVTYDYQSFSYFSTTNNINTITYRSGGAAGTIVAVTRFNYAAGGVANDDRVVVIATTST